METSSESVRVWQLLVAHGCEQINTARVLDSGLTVHGVEIRQGGQSLAYGEDPVIRIALLRAMLEAVQVISLPAPGSLRPGLEPRPSPHGRHSGRWSRGTTEPTSPLSALHG